jgi:hypothetical protein
MLTGYCRNKHRLRPRGRMMTIPMPTQPSTRITPHPRLPSPLAFWNTELSMVAPITASRVMLSTGIVQASQLDIFTVLTFSRASNDEQQNDLMDLT